MPLGLSKTDNNYSIWLHERYLSSGSAHFKVTPLTVIIHSFAGPMLNTFQRPCKRDPG